MLPTITITDPAKMFVRSGPTVQNIATIANVMAGSHRASDPTTFLVTYVDSNTPYPIKGEDAEVFAIDFHRQTGVDLFAVTGVRKPNWVAVEMGDIGEFVLPIAPRENMAAAYALEASLGLFRPTHVGA